MRTKAKVLKKTKVLKTHQKIEKTSIEKNTSIEIIVIFSCDPNCYFALFNIPRATIMLRDPQLCRARAPDSATGSRRLAGSGALHALVPGMCF